MKIYPKMFGPKRSFVKSVPDSVVHEEGDEGGEGVEEKPEEDGHRVAEAVALQG
jgi:hypothetical protein